MSDNVYREIVWEDGILKSISPEEIETELDEEVIEEEITRMPDVFCCKMSVSRVSPLGLIRESHFPCWSFINPLTKDPLIVKKGDDVVTNNNYLECKWKTTIVRIDRSRVLTKHFINMVRGVRAFNSIKIKNIVSEFACNEDPKMSDPSTKKRENKLKCNRENVFLCDK